MHLKRKVVIYLRSNTMFQASSYLYWGLWTVAESRKRKSDSSVRTIVSPVGRNLPRGIVSERKIRFP